MASNTLVDWKWMSKGGLLSDAQGDICFTANSNEVLTAMAITRLQADLNAWKCYPGLGADLDALRGNTVSEEMETAVQRQVTQALTNQFLTAGSFTVETIQVGPTITIYVYVQGVLIATTDVSVG